MLISHAHRFIYMAVPRTASTSTREILRQALKPGQFDEIARGKVPQSYQASHPQQASQMTVHVRAPQVRAIFPREWESYAKLANIRHPYTRCLSAFSFWLGAYAPQKTREKFWQDRSHRIWAGAYEDFLRRQDFPPLFEAKEKGYYFLDDRAIDIQPIRYEHLRADLQKLRQRFALPLDPTKNLPWHYQYGAQQRDWTVRQLMTAQAKALIDARYAWYFERFGYQKDIAD